MYMHMLYACDSDAHSSSAESRQVGSYARQQLEAQSLDAKSPKTNGAEEGVEALTFKVEARREPTK